MPFEALDLSQVPIGRRGGESGALREAHVFGPGSAARTLGAGAIADRIAASRQAGRPVLWLVSPQAIAAGLGPAIGDLLRRGFVTHLATDGTAAAHDFALAVSGEADPCPFVAMDEESIRLFHAAARSGARDGLGLGEALGRFLAGEPASPHCALSLTHAAYACGVALTVHVTAGAGPFWPHPACDPGALGWASAQDFLILAATSARLDGGVVVSAGAWPGGEALLQSALAAARRLGRLTDGPAFAHVGLDGQGLGAAMAQLQTALPALDDGPGAPAGGRGRRPAGRAAGATVCGALAAVAQRSAAAGEVLQGMVARHPALAGAAPSLARAYLAIAGSLAHGGTLFLCGNGGSFADALHISGEMLKSYAHPRPLPEGHRVRLAQERNGEALVASLQRGLRAVVLGANPALASAVSNDFAVPNLNYAQELYALARPGDAFLGISTSGKAANVGSAAGVARALGLATIGLTGAAGGPLAEQVEIAIRAPESRTDRIQEQHVVLYHALCEMLEVDLCQAP